jgi:hypothetical protein
MNPEEIVAYIGAAAWLPQIISWIYKAISKPSLKFISSPTLELGYTTLGPILNLTSSISASKRDALIDKITLEVVHEKGETRLLTWSFLNEKQQEIRNYRGETAEITKNQPAIALKVPTITLAEKLIGFQDLEFQAKFKLHTNKLLELESFLKKESPDTAVKLFTSKEFRDFLDFFKNQMYWKEGEYELSVVIHEVRLRNPYIERFSFSLTKTDVERLTENCSKLEKDAKNFLNVSSEDSDLPKWNWVYPEVQSID